MVARAAERFRAGRAHNAPNLGISGEERRQLLKLNRVRTSAHRNMTIELPNTGFKMELNSKSLHPQPLSRTPNDNQDTTKKAPGDHQHDFPKYWRIQDGGPKLPPHPLSV